MKPPGFLSSVLASIVLSSCASAVKPYSSEQETWRADVREGQQSELRRLYEQGLHDGRFDAAEHQGPRQVADVTAAEKENGDGYREGYGAAGEPVRDEVYNQGFDYGMRDRARKKPSDPEAHIGDYDARFRLSFERGYLDGYNR